MTYVHVFWTRPYLKPHLEPAAQEIVLWDFESLTWLLSALQARRFGPLRMVTDSRGALAVHRAGLDWVYNDGISTALDSVPQELDSSTFWAGAKLYAYGLVQPPYVCLDMDAVLWKPLVPVSPVMALHQEGKNWVWYSDNRQDYEPFGLQDPGWNWELDPFNTGVVHFGNPEAARFYVETATGFAERYSREVCAVPERRPAQNNAMLFAEQRLLPMCAARQGLTVAPITHTPAQAIGLPQNPECLHLWRAKLAYKICPDSRLALVNWLIQFLLDNFPESRQVLSRWNLDHPRTALERLEISPDLIADVHKGDLRFSLLKNLAGSILVRDLTSGIVRKASEGSMVWSGEIIHPEPGARFELEVVGLQSINVGAIA